MSSILLVSIPAVVPVLLDCGAVQCHLSTCHITHFAVTCAEFCIDLLDKMGERFAGPIAILRNWTFCMFYVMAELWGSVVVSVLFWGRLPTSSNWRIPLPFSLLCCAFLPKFISCAN